MLDAIGAGLAPRIGEKDWADIWRESPEYQRMLREIEQIKQEGLARPPPERNNETTCKLIVFVMRVVLIVLCRCNAILGPSQGSRQAEQLGTVAFSRLRVQPPLRPRLHLTVHLPVIPTTRRQLA